MIVIGDKELIIPQIKLDISRRLKIDDNQPENPNTIIFEKKRSKSTSRMQCTRCFSFCPWTSADGDRSDPQESYTLVHSKQVKKQSLYTKLIPSRIKSDVERVEKSKSQKLLSIDLKDEEDEGPPTLVDRDIVVGEVSLKKKMKFKYPQTPGYIMK